MRVFSPPCVSGIYVMVMSSCSAVDQTMDRKPPGLYNWHRRMGHRSLKAIVKMVQ